jgi:DMSO reductase family type II enzyme heme b subunit
VVAAVLVALGCAQEPDSAVPDAAPAPVAVSAPGAAALTLPLTHARSATSWNDPNSPRWLTVPAAALLLNRTPPSFATDPVRGAAPPAADVRAVTDIGHLYLRLRWEDRSEERWSGPTAQPFAAERIYKRPTVQPAAFYDAAAVMVPAGGTWRARFPSMVMGDAASPVTLYLWRNGDQPQVLTAQGRGTVAPAPAKRFTATVTRAPGGWVGIFVLPAPEPDMPLAFAIWDGAQAQRNGDKFFTPWYRPTPAGSPKP